MGPIELQSMRTTQQAAEHLEIWEWQIPVYLFLGGLVAGLMVIGAVQSLRKSGQWDSRLSLWGAALAAVFLSVGMLALFLDLSQKMYVYRFYLAFRPTSPMSWGSWILVLAYPAIGLWALMSITDKQWSGLIERVGLLRPVGQVRRWAMQHRNAVLYATAFVGAALGTYTGILLQTLIARPLWTSPVMGPLFLASGVSGAAALYMLLRAGSSVQHSLVKWDLIALTVEGLLLSMLLLEKLNGTAAERVAARLLVAGPYTGVFFSLVVATGILAPLALEGWELKKGTRGTMAAPVLVLLGGMALRAVIVAAGLESGVGV